MIRMDRKPGRAPKRAKRKPEPGRFASATFFLPDREPLVPSKSGFIVASLIAAGMAAGALWPQGPLTADAADDIFVMEEELPPPPPQPLPTPPVPQPPPKVTPPPEPPPPPQAGLEEGDLSSTGDLAVASGNTLMKDPEPETAPPAPPLPPAPIFIDRPPRLLAGAAPEYPREAEARGLEGTVVALITIDTAGAVTQVSIEKSAGIDFDQCALAAVRAARFQAPVRDGRKVPARFRWPFEFKLE
jgi:TonB family protein